MLRFLILWTVLSTAAMRVEAMTQVIFFGGSGASEENLNNWRSKVSQRIDLSPRFQFRTYALPTQAYKQKQVLWDAKYLIDAIVNEIESSPEDRQYILVGHSSGSAIANQVAREVRNGSKVKLIVLEGFTPNRISREVEIRCWSARDTRGLLFGMNRRGMSSCLNFQEIKYDGCKTKMCLHLLFVNSAAPQLGINSKNFKQTGYQNLVPNLIWLKEFAIP